MTDDDVKKYGLAPNDPFGEEPDIDAVRRGSEDYVEAQHWAKWAARARGAPVDLSLVGGRWCLRKRDVDHLEYVLRESEALYQFNREWDDESAEEERRNPFIE